MIKNATRKLVDRENLGAEESRGVMMQLMSGEATPVQMAAYLTALRQKGETSDEILGSARAMRDNVCRVKHHHDALFDNCGTGGDGAGTFNISTTTSFVLAACGLKIAKHGNRSVSSRCGSADLLQALGAEISLMPEQMADCIDEVGIGFLFAPTLHPAMKQVAPVRKELGFRTIFNILGPLTNPAFATHQMIGVFDERYTKKVAVAARNLGVKSVIVVFNRSHVDELTTAGTNVITKALNGSMSTSLVEPRALGFKECRVEDLRGGDADENARTTCSILQGESGPRRDTVLLNAAVALVAAEKTEVIADGLKMAEEAIDSGAARQKLDRFVEFTRRCVHA